MSTILLSLILSLAGSVNVQSYELVAEDSTLDWTGYAAAGNYSQSGTLHCSSGSMTITAGEITALELVVDMTSLAHENRELEKHLKQKDFFHVKKYPKARLVFLERLGDKFMFTLTILGKSRQIEVPVDPEKIEGGFVHRGRLIIDRTQFGIKYNSASYFQDLGSYAIKDDFELAYRLVFKVR
jgi:polyisoprenoid-binding protein YceI